MTAHCIVCGVKFSPYRAWQETCGSPKCSARHYYQKCHPEGQPRKDAHKAGTWYEVVDTEQIDRYMIGGVFSSLEVNSMLNLGSLPPYAVLECAGELFDVVAEPGRYGAAHQKLVGQESGRVIISRVAQRGNHDNHL